MDMGGMTMRHNVLMIGVLVMLAAAAGATPWAETYPLSGTTVALTNREVNSVWMPVAVLWKFSPATNATVTVTRISQGNAYQLGTLSVTNASTVIWFPEAEFPFEYGDILQVSSTETNSQVQVIRKGN